jgi:hypothetical protein
MTKANIHEDGKRFFIFVPPIAPGAKNGASNGGLQLRRAISIQVEGKQLLENHAIAPAAARLCYVALLL